MKKSLIVIIILCFFQCKITQHYIPQKVEINKAIVYDDSLIDKTKWQNKDIIDDSVPGISLDKAYNTILKNGNAKEVIVAILDTKIDINHEAYKNQIWINSDEKPNNDIDDDHNGFIDDVNGWNFLGNSKGESLLIENYEYVRIIRNFESNNRNQDVMDTLNTAYLNYKRAKNKYNKEIVKSEKNLKKSKKIMTFYHEAREALSEYFPDYKYSYDILNTIDTVDNGLGKYVKEIKLVLDYNDTDENMNAVYQNRIDSYEKKNNINYFPRKLVGDNPRNINDSVYGNNIVSDYLDIINHGTRVTGIISCSTEIKSNIKIMPINIVPNGGTTQDKDIALGIRYAVDNGAKVINMSFGKDFASNVEWLKDAFLYAEKHNVLIVSAAGNEGENIDNNLYIYPNDRYNNEAEFCNNFLYVGANSYKINSNLISYSDYGKENVDIFAPGEKMYTTYPNNKYEYDSGTSLAAALTSKVAALIFSYYPNLTASQVKHIIMDSGVEYTFPVKTPTKEDKDKMTPFNELSKSGKIVNAYNALIMADSVSKANKKRKGE